VNLDDWMAEAAAALSRPELALTAAQQAEILDLARVAAHSVARPAAPLTTFLAGYALGAGGGLDRLSEVAAALGTAAGNHAAPPEGS
jgi:Domain of unknown function (DUF6457)